MQYPWLATIEMGGQGTAVAEALEALAGQGMVVEGVPADAAPDVLGSRLPVLALAYTHALTLDVLDLLRLLHRQDVPVIVVADHLSEDDELILLHGGAWVAFAIPLSTRLLRARLVSLHAHLALPGVVHEEVRRIDNVTINLRRREVTVDDRAVPLTRTEFDLLLAFAADPVAVVVREQLLHDVEGGPIGPRSLESHLSRLRLKIAAAGGPRLIEPVRGVGYRLHAPRTVAREA